MQTACGIHKHNINLRIDALRHRVKRHRCGVCAFRTTHRVRTNATSPRLQLVGRSSAERIGCAQQHLVPHGHQDSGKLAGGGGFARAIHADQHNHSRFAFVRHRLNRTIQLWFACFNEGFTQHGTRFFLTTHTTLGDFLPQFFHHVHGDGGSQVRHEQGVFDFFPGVIIQVTSAQHAQDTLTKHVLRLRQPSTQPAQATCSWSNVFFRCLLLSRGFWLLGLCLLRRGLWHRGFFQRLLRSGYLCLSRVCSFFSLFSIVLMFVARFGCVILGLILILGGVRGAFV